MIKAATEAPRVDENKRRGRYLLKSLIKGALMEIKI